MLINRKEANLEMEEAENGITVWVDKQRRSIRISWHTGKAWWNQSQWNANLSSAQRNLILLILRLQPKSTDPGRSVSLSGVRCVQIQTQCTYLCFTGVFRQGAALQSTTRTSAQHEASRANISNNCWPLPWK